DKLRELVALQLTRRAIALLERHVRKVKVKLLKVNLQPVAEALDAIARGEWTRGRKLLEQVVRSPEMQALTVQKRARVYYDLGQARQFDPSLGSDVAAQFESAKRAFRAALELDPTPRYLEALRELERHRGDAELVRAQKSAAQSNFGAASHRLPPPP